MSEDADPGQPEHTERHVLFENITKDELATIPNKQRGLEHVEIFIEVHNC